MDRNLANELKRLRDERQKKFDEQDWTGALEIHDKILELSPSALRYANRGSILFRLGRLEDAVESYRQALSMDPNLKRAQADLERLEAQLQQLPAKSPKHSSTPTSLNQVNGNIAAEDDKQRTINELRDDRQKRMGEGDWNGALELHNQILEIEPNALRYANQGSILYRMGKIREAIQSYQKALELDPSLERARLDLEKLESQVEEEQLLGQGKGKKKVESAHQEKADELRKKRQEKIKEGDWDSALKLHDELLQYEPTALRYANRGALLYRMGRYQEALQSYRKALELDPQLTKAKEDMASLEAQIEEEGLLSAGSKSGSMSTEERNEKIAQLRDERQSYIDAKEWTKALDIHDKLIELDPTALRYVNRGSMCYRMGELEKAVESYRIALEMNPNLGRAQHDLARLEAELATRKVQEQALKPQASETSPVVAQEMSPEKKVEILEQLRIERQEKVEAGDWQGALVAQDRMIELEPDSASRYINRGSILYRMGRVDDAILSYGKALELDPDLDRAREDIERIKDSELDRLRRTRQEMMEKEDWEGTLKVHDVIMVLEPSPLRHANRGSILYRLGKLEEAAAAYRHALQMDPDLDNAKDDLAQIEVEMKEKQAAKGQIPEQFRDDDDDVFPPEEMPVSTAQEEEERPAETAAEALEEKKECLETISAHEKKVTNLLMTADGKYLISASQDCNIKIWDANKRECVHVLKGHQDWIRSLVISHGGDKIISAGDDWNVRVWDIQSGKCEQTYVGHSMPVLSACVSKNDRFVLSAGRDQSIRIWDLKGGKQLNYLKGHEDWVSSIAIAPEGNKAISAGYDKTIRIWNVLGWRCTQTIESHNGWIEKLFITPDGKYFASVSRDCTARVWNLSTCEQTAVLDSHGERIVDSFMSADGSLLACAGRSLHVWEIPDGKSRLSVQNGTFERVLVTPDNNFVVAADDSKIWIWDIRNPEAHLLQSWTTNTLDSGMQFGISCFSYIPKDQIVVAGNCDGSIKFWEISDSERAHQG